MNKIVRRKLTIQCMMEIGNIRDYSSLISRNLTYYNKSELTDNQPKQLCLSQYKQLQIKTDKTNLYWLFWD